jgi:hypothetical protein
VHRGCRGGIAVQAPDPFIPNGDPCCGHPDTWGEVAEGVALTLGLVVVDALVPSPPDCDTAWAHGALAATIERQSQTSSK